MCAWAAPATAVTGAVAEAADFNNHRDDLNETAVAKSTAAGDMTYATGTNALARLAIGTAGQELMVNSSTSAPAWITRGSATADVITSEATTSTTYTDLATAGPAVSPAPGVAKDHLIIVSARMNSGGSNRAYMSPSIAGAAADDENAAFLEGASTIATRATLAASQASGATHTAKYRSASTGATATFQNRRIIGAVI